MYFKMKKCDKKFAANGLNVSHIGFAVYYKTIQIGKGHEKLGVISKENFLNFSFENSRLTVILQTLLSDWCPLPPKKANYRVCLTLSHLYKYHKLPEMGPLTLRYL